MKIGAPGRYFHLLKSSFREGEFAKVEFILIQREEKLKEELESLKSINSARSCNN